MIKDVIPASVYEGALELASLQRRLLPPWELIAVPKGPSVNYYRTFGYFRRILCDATLASVTVAAWRGLPHTHVYTDAYGSYYCIRMLVLAGCCDPRARRGGQALSEKSTSTQTIFSCVDLCSFICGYARDLEPGIKHGVYTHKKDSGIKDESNGSEYRFADDGESNDSEDQSDDGSEDGSGDGKDGSSASDSGESDGSAGGFPMLPSYDGRTPEWKRAIEVLEAARSDWLYRTRELKKTILKTNPT